MRMRDKLSILSDAILDPLVTDSEFRLLTRLSLKFGTEKIIINDETISVLNVPKSTLYRLLGGLLKRQYVQRVPGDNAYMISVPEMRMSNLIIENDESHSLKSETEKTQTERKERSKEKKELNDIDLLNSSGIKENDKEKEILKKEKADGEDECGEPPKRKSRPFVKPTVDEVRAYCRERKSTVRAQSFVDFYESKGWMVGKNRMKDWKAAVRTWEQKDKERGNHFVPPENQQTDDDGYPF